MDAEALLQGLDTSQHEAVTSEAAPLGILAGAGSGKTRVLTRRIAYRVATGTADAPHVLAVTFTRRAAAELRQRLWRLGVRDRLAAGTFHSVAWGAIRQRAVDQGRPAPTLLGDRTKVVTSLLDERRQGRRGGSVAEVVGEIDWAKARGIGADHYADEARRHGRHPPSGIDAVAEQFAKYEISRRKGRQLDFDDLLSACADALRNDRRWAEAQRWRFRHLFVDEFQDVSPLQFALLDAWRGGRDDVCVVGDPNQSIYAWNGAEPDFLRRLPTHLPGTTIVRLTTNYRSTPQVLAVAETVFAPPPRLRGRRPVPPDPSGDPFQPAIPAAGDGPAPTVREFADEQAEAAGIARLLGDARPPGGLWSSSAVLARTHAQLAPIARALTAAGVPHRRPGRRLAEQPAVRALVAEARRSTPWSGLAALADDLAAQLAAPDEDDELRQSDAATPEPLDENDRAALGDVLGLVRDELAADPHAPLSALATVVAADDTPGGRRDDGVDLVTFHAAKGLEWPTVVVAGVEDGFVPLAGARGGAARHEEARLLYVALTRARHRLFVTWAKARHRGLDLVPRAPSPWLAAIEQKCAELDERPDVEVVGAYLADAHRQVDPAHRGTPPLPALRAWRAHAARAARVDEIAVVADDVLAAIAARRPATVAELADVPGVGVLLARRHGPAVLAALAGTHSV